MTVAKARAQCSAARGPITTRCFRADMDKCLRALLHAGRHQGCTWNLPVGSPLMLRQRLGARCRNWASNYTSTTHKSERPKGVWGTSKSSSHDCMHHPGTQRQLRNPWRSLETSYGVSIRSVLSCDEELQEASSLHGSNPCPCTAPKTDAQWCRQSLDPSAVRKRPGRSKFPA
jgi:hypothetical protein